MARYLQEGTGNILVSMETTLEQFEDEESPTTVCKDYEELLRDV